MSPVIIHEIKNALRGCLEIAVFLKIGMTRFEGTIPAFKRSLLIPFLIVPLVVLTVPAQGVLEGKSFLWLSVSYIIHIIIAIIYFMILVRFMKNRLVTREDYLRTIVIYNWLSVPSYALNIPLILMGHLGVHTWDDVSAMMLLITLYCYSYLAYVLTYSLRTTLFFGITIAMLDLMLGEIISNLVKYVVFKT